MYEIEIGSGVAITGGFNSDNGNGHIKLAARDIVIEDIVFIVCFHKYEEEFFEVENVNGFG
jgi:hypothetical protein